MKKREEVAHNEDQKIQLLNNGKADTSNYIKEKLKELELIADEIIKYTIWRWERNPRDIRNIYKETKSWLFQRIGQGSIGPVTAATGPLLREKLEELEKLYKKRF